jgi:hypothetical protein
MAVNQFYITISNSIDTNHNPVQEKLHIIFDEFYGWLCKLE